MSEISDMECKKIGRPRAIRYLLGAIAGSLVLVFLALVLGILLFNSEFRLETAMDKIRWIGIPIFIVTLYFGATWIQSSRIANARELEWKQKAEQLKHEEAKTHTDQAHREYVLEVIGLGVTVEKYRQGALWDILQQGNPHSSIRESDPKKYAWAANDKDGVSGARACDALENGASYSSMYWGVPSFYAGPPFPKESTIVPSSIDPIAGLAGSAVGTGMAWHLFVTAPWELAERPDRLLERVFSFFDEHPDLPYVALLSEDSPGTRDFGKPYGTPRLLNDGYYIPSMPDSTAVFILARRDRVEPLRPYVWDDPNNDFVQETLRRMYFDLKDTVPTPEKLANPKSKFNVGRQPTVEEWLPAAAQYAKHPALRRDVPEGILGSFSKWQNIPPKDWKPTPWFPIPWNKDQMATFDRMPSLGFIHRPTFVKFSDENGHAITRRDQRQKILEAGWTEALQSLPLTEREKGPARIIAAMNNHTEQIVALENMLHHYAANGGPEIDTSTTAQFINTDRRLGNTGAATLFVQMALGVIGSYRNGGVSAAINLRDPSEASIIFISPPSDEKRKEQADRGDVFSHKVTPAIDPENYKAPSVEAMIENANRAKAASH